MNTTRLKQRADLTFKYNAKEGRFGWLRLTPAYSIKIVQEILSDNEKNITILDPFSGTATTPLLAGYLGYKSTGIEINPFLTWFGRIKTSTYDDSTIKSAHRFAEVIIEKIVYNQVDPIEPPAIHNIDRWWDINELDFLCKLKSGINQISNEEIQAKNLLLVAFCRLMIGSSKVSFSHQSMSFKDKDKKRKAEKPFFPKDLPLTFKNEVKFVLNSALDNPKSEIDIIEGDSRTIPKVTRSKFDLVITSPPYPNRISYIRELRPYMYWVNFFNKARDAAEMDWKAIGGTWGIATSRLLGWHRSSEEFYPDYLQAILTRIAANENKNGILMANYISKYFEDIWVHLKGLKAVLSLGSKIHYIVGNSTFYNILLPVELLFKDMFLKLGFTNTNIRALRKRNSKKELLEYDVSAEFI
jgi:DNA modification methylase